MRVFKLFIVLYSSFYAFQSVAGEESIINLQYEPQVSANTQPIVPLSQCGVLVEAPQDKRLNNVTLGTTFRDNPIMSKQAASDWLHHALLDMKRLGINTSESQTPNTTVLTTELDKLYIWNHSMNLYATVVVNATIKKGSDVISHKKYRVIGTKLNWANGDGEFVTTLNIAATRLLDQIATDISAQCKI